MYCQTRIKYLGMVTLNTRVIRIYATIHIRITVQPMTGNFHCPWTLQAHVSNAFCFPTSDSRKSNVAHHGLLVSLQALVNCSHLRAGKTEYCGHNPLLRGSQENAKIHDQLRISTCYN